jgi:hypothetical protein
MKKFIVFIITCFILTGNVCFSWNLKGHQTVAKIAELNVKPETLAKIKNILKNGDTMVSIAGWADDEIRITRKETDKWHTTPISIKNDVTLQNISSFYPKTENILIYQLKKEISELKNKSTPPELQNEDLKFLIHFAGDLHMPMHCASNGGKNIIDTEKNKAKEKPETLHNVWDSILPIKNIDEYAKQLNNSITEEQRKKWSVNSPDEWVFESFTISKRIIFKDIPYGAKYITLPDGYKKKMAPVAEEQIKKAGIRLAMLLDDIFSK